MAGLRSHLLAAEFAVVQTPPGSIDVSLNTATHAGCNFPTNVVMPLDFIRNLQPQSVSNDHQNTIKIFIPCVLCRPCRGAMLLIREDFDHITPNACLL